VRIFFLIPFLFASCSTTLSKWVWCVLNSNHQAHFVQYFTAISVAVAVGKIWPSRAILENVLIYYFQDLIRFIEQ
jgi:hypothetical protein